ncbi:hypothetical protein C4D60_Mb05t16150 [Musa balbisiana]|uniref:Uncharacterized protein n=1 Tax=Musa balbisiana TaxID=52838 RepID=A0A4S8JWI4_MUSBA|nr:hypothetical protein C4D60_Mb05t16150 [Musa balbisiana]
MARLLIFVLGDRSYGADSTAYMTGILFMLGLVAATISIMAVVIFNCGDSNETKPKSENKIGGGGCGGGGCGGGGCGGGCGGDSKTTYTLLCFFGLNQSPSCSRVQLMKAKAKRGE